MTPFVRTRPSLATLPPVKKRMITAKESMESLPGMQAVIDDRRLMLQIVNRRRRVWAITWVLATILLFLYGMFMLPQSFTSTVSIAMDQSSSVGAIGSLLPGLSGGSKKYVGVLKSRAFAEKVEAKIHLQQPYHLPKKEDALDQIKLATHFDDNVNDGLIYIEVTLRGPARFAPGASDLRERVRQAAADAANVYPDALVDY